MVSVETKIYGYDVETKAAGAKTKKGRQVFGFAHSLLRLQGRCASRVDVTNKETSTVVEEQKLKLKRHTKGRGCATIEKIKKASKYKSQ